LIGPAGLERAECGAGGPLDGLGTQRDGRDESHLTIALCDGWGLCGLDGVASLMGDGVGAGGPLGGLGTQRDGRDESHLTGALCDGRGLCGLDAWLRSWALMRWASSVRDDTHRGFPQGGCRVGRLLEVAGFVPRGLGSS
jgi:hypothetical protein